MVISKQGLIYMDKNIDLYNATCRCMYCTCTSTKQKLTLPLSWVQTFSGVWAFSVAY